MIIDHSDRRNAMTKQMWEQIPELCDLITQSSEIRAVVLRGAGTVAFVAGADISEFNETRQGSAGDDYDRMTAAATDALATLPKPVVALIHGFCIGGGLALALSADIRIAADDAVFGLPPARLGIGYSPTGIGTLVDLIGPAAAKELIFSADWIDAAKANRFGLVNDIVPGGQLDDVVATRVATMARRAPLSQLAAKRAVANHLADPQHRDDAAVAALVRRCIESDDYQEGIAAFLEKRPPRFTGS
jgi:enoyl-CoA hydratase/carnithine racemase